MSHYPGSHYQGPTVWADWISSLLARTAAFTTRWDTASSCTSRRSWPSKWCVNRCFFDLRASPFQFTFPISERHRGGVERGNAVLWYDQPVPAQDRLHREPGPHDKQDWLRRLHRGGAARGDLLRRVPAHQGTFHPTIGISPTILVVFARHPMIWYLYYRAFLLD